MVCKHENAWLDGDVAQLLQSVTLELELRTLDLGALIDSIIAGLPEHERARVEHLCRHRITVRGDEARLRFGIGNLVAMSLSCSLAGSHVTVRTTQHESRASISILATARPRDHQWIALELARKIAEAHDGSAAVAMLDDAVRFCMVLPANSRMPRRWPAHTSILVVEDNVEQSAALAEVLRLEGLTVRCATSGLEALALVETTTPHLMIVDLQLPDLDGAAVIKQARASKPELPTALLTGYPVDHPVVADTLATTEAQYLPKPVNIEALLALVAHAVR